MVFMLDDLWPDMRNSKVEIVYFLSYGDIKGLESEERCTWEGPRQGVAGNVVP
jgi:hypothetical protein